MGVIKPGRKLDEEKKQLKGESTQGHAEAGQSTTEKPKHCLPLPTEGGHMAYIMSTPSIRFVSKA